MSGARILLRDRRPCNGTLISHAMVGRCQRNECRLVYGRLSDADLPFVRLSRNALTHGLHTIFSGVWSHSLLWTPSGG